MLKAERSWHWLPEPADIATHWRRIVNQHAVQGKTAHDARLVAFMEAHGLTHLLTLNTYRGIAIITAREFCAWLDQ